MEEEELRVCQNCQEKFPLFKIDLHEAYCRRNIRRCKICFKMVDINDEESHHNQFHAQKACEYCKQNIPVQELSSHIEICSHRPIQCLYCQNPYPFSAISKHQEQCGSRTRLCELCRKYIKIKDEKEHTEKCQVQLRRNESHELRRLPNNPVLRQRMNSNDNSKKQVIPHSPRLVPKKGMQPILIEKEPISQLVDPIPISIRLAMQREREKGRLK